jgi:Type I restriction enzyme R protein N terminus (HSDR_N)
MVTLRANEITLKETREILGFRAKYDGRFEDFLNLQPLTPEAQQGLDQIVGNFMVYLEAGKISEGQARQISINPILELAGYHRAPIELRIEEDIQRIDIKDKDTHIRGRMDIVAINRTVNTSATSLLWVLIVESKNLDASEFNGIAQMLTYAHGSLKTQAAVWGLVTNGATYQFFHIQQSETPTYQYFPSLRLLERDRAHQLLQVLAAIRDWQP